MKDTLESFCRSLTVFSFKEQQKKCNYYSKGKGPQKEVEALLLSSMYTAAAGK